MLVFNLFKRKGEFRIGIQKGGEREKLNWSLEQAQKKVTRRLKNQFNIRKYAMTAIVKEW